MSSYWWLVVATYVIARTPRGGDSHLSLWSTTLATAVELLLHR